MSDFEQWHKENAKYIEPLDVIPWCESAYLAGQASADYYAKYQDKVTEVEHLREKCAELERERDKLLQQRADILDNQAALVAEIHASYALKAQASEPVAWMSPNKERIEFSRPDTVYGSHTIPLFTHPATERRVPDMLNWIDSVLPVVEIFGTTPSQKQWSRDRVKEAREYLSAAPKREETK